MFAIKTCKSYGQIVGYLPREISRVTKFLLDRGAILEATSPTTHYRRSPLVRGRLEIACKISRPGVVACTCNPATLEAEFRNRVGSIPVGGNSPSIGGWIV